MNQNRDEEKLKNLGYSQELKRSLSGFSNFAISFSVISILTGSITLYGYGLQTAGPFGIIVGWIIVSIASVFIVLSMAELASAFPTAGALYHWSSFLGNKHYGWFTAWFNFVGQVATTAGIDYGMALFIANLLGLQGSGTLLTLYAVLLLSHGIFNHYGIRAVALLNGISVWYHMAVTFLIIGAFSFFAPRLHSFGFEKSIIP